VIDQNMALREIRKLITRIRADLDRRGFAQAHETDRLTYLVEALDEQIMYGGSLPTEWSTDTRERRAESEGKLGEIVRTVRGKKG
jgi:hypothetical protein